MLFILWVCIFGAAFEILASAQLKCTKLGFGTLKTWFSWNQLAL